MLRNEVISGLESIIESSLGHVVLTDKAILSYDCEQPDGLIGRMADKKTERQELDAFIDRVRAARLARFKTQTPLLTILEVDQGTYKQYEGRTPLPYRYIPKFVAATGVSIEWLLTGQGEGPSLANLPPRKSRRTRTVAKGKRGKAA